jgi:hypothetical protein
VYWTNEVGQYSPLATRFDGDVAVAQVTHFSNGFVGAACRGDDCCRQGVGGVDVLFLVDNSNSMAEEQRALAAQFEHMIGALTTGDVDGDGVQDFAAADALHIGVITADLGTGGFRVPTCEAEHDVDGILQTSGRLSGCAETYPSFLTFAPGDDAEAVASDFSCIANVGTGGCGFEQQLEATLKALTPTSSPLRFAGAPGHGDGANAGFLRPDALLTVVMLTDEDDCSAEDLDLYNPESTTYTEDLNIRCLRDGALHPIARYVDGLIALRDDPTRVVFAAITGVPVDLAGRDYDAILADPRMFKAPDRRAETPRLVPACAHAESGIAVPGRRIVRTAQGIEDAGGSATVQSICNPDFAANARAVVERVARRVSGYCDGEPQGGRWRVDEAGALGSCVAACSTDADCQIGGMDAGFRCIGGECAPQAFDCRSFEAPDTVCRGISLGFELVDRDGDGLGETLCTAERTGEDGCPDGDTCCPPGDVCTATGLCARPIAEAECPDEMTTITSIDGVFVTVCSTHATWSFCDETGHCVAPRPSPYCETDDDCTDPSMPACNDGCCSCVVSEERGDSCSAPGTAGGSCLPAGSCACTADSECVSPFDGGTTRTCQTG